MTFITPLGDGIIEGTEIPRYIDFGQGSNSVSAVRIAGVPAAWGRSTNDLPLVPCCPGLSKKISL
ncbi:MAG: hypothetical protein H0Z39_04860 [Peptococcaceae bacterium]|nr:hypothetical protein [Peptococcaceae bacterium]